MIKKIIIGTFLTAVSFASAMDKKLSSNKTITLITTDNRKIELSEVHANFSKFIAKKFEMLKKGIDTTSTFKLETPANEEIDLSEKSLNVLFQQLDKAWLNTLSDTDLKKALHTADYLELDSNFVRKLALAYGARVKHFDPQTEYIYNTYVVTPQSLLERGEITNRASSEVLNLERLNIDSLHGLQELVEAQNINTKNIKYLFLNNNKLTTVDRDMIKYILTVFPKLRHLDLSNNCIKIIGENAFRDLPNGLIKKDHFKLLLNNNNIYELPLNCIPATFKGFIDLCNNPLQSSIVKELVGKVGCCINVTARQYFGKKASCMHCATLSKECDTTLFGKTNCCKKFVCSTCLQAYSLIQHRLDFMFNFQNQDVIVCCGKLATISHHFDKSKKK